MDKKATPKKRNRQDTTTINNNARKREIKELQNRYAALEERVSALEVRASSEQPHLPGFERAGKADV